MHLRNLLKPIAQFKVYYMWFRNCAKKWGLNFFLRSDGFRLLVSFMEISTLKISKHSILYKSKKIFIIKSFPNSIFVLKEKIKIEFNKLYMHSAYKNNEIVINCNKIS